MIKWPGGGYKIDGQSGYKVEWLTIEEIGWNLDLIKLEHGSL